MGTDVTLRIFRGNSMAANDAIHLRELASACLPCEVYHVRLNPLGVFPFNFEVVVPHRCHGVVAFSGINLFSTQYFGSPRGQQLVVNAKQLCPLLSFSNLLTDPRPDPIAKAERV